MKRVFAILGLVVLVAMGNATAEAQTDAVNWPRRSITLMLGWAPGGGADLTSRAVFQPFVEDILGQDVVITYKVGAAGEVSFVELAHSRPDGYTFGWTVTPNLVSFPVSRDTQYTLEDLEPVANLAYDPGVFVVPMDGPFRTLQDLVEYAKAQPDRVTVGNGGTGGDDFLAVRKFEREAGVAVTQVPFAEGTGAQITALLGGHIMVSAINASEALQYVQAGNVRVLGVMDTERSPILPDVPTFAEEGYRVVSGSARGFSAPAGTPREIIQKMADAIRQALDDPAFQERAANLKLLIRYMGPDEYKAMLEEERESLAQLFAEDPW